MKIILSIFTVILYHVSMGDVIKPLDPIIVVTHGSEANINYNVVLGTGDTFHSLHIFCNIDGFEHVLAFELKGQQLTVSSDNSLPTQFRGRLKAANRGLTINPVLFGYDFDIKFHAELIYKNYFGDSIVRKTPSTKLVVEIPPKIERFERLLSVPENRSAILECVVSGNPIPNVVWDMGENHENIQDIKGKIFKIIYNNSTSSRLRPPDKHDLNRDYMNVDYSTYKYIVGSYINVTNLKRHQSRKISCTAIVNVFSTAFKNSILDVTYPSGPPLSLRAVQVSQTSVVLDWSGISSIGHPPITIEYLIEYRIVPDIVLSPSKINSSGNPNDVTYFNNIYGRGPYPGTIFYDSTHPLYWGGPYYNDRFIQPLNISFQIQRPKPYSYFVASGAADGFSGPMWSPWDVEPWDGYNWIKIRTPRSLHTIVSLLPSTMYAFRLRAHNGAGYSVPCQEIRVRTTSIMMYRGDWAFEFTYPWLIISIIAFVLVLFLVLSCLASTIHKKRKKIKFITLSNSKKYSKDDSNCYPIKILQNKRIDPKSSFIVGIHDSSSMKNTNPSMVSNKSYTKLNDNDVEEHSSVFLHSKYQYKDNYSTRSTRPNSFIVVNTNENERKKSTYNIHHSSKTWKSDLMIDNNFEKFNYSKSVPDIKETNNIVDSSKSVNIVRDDDYSIAYV